MKIYKYPVRPEFELEKPKPKIEFRYCVVFEKYFPDPKDYDMETPLEELTAADLLKMAEMDAEDASSKLEFYEPDGIYIDIIVNDTVIRRVKA